MAYRQQQACSDPLREPGQWDLTAHLCLESLLEAAAAAGWQSLGHCRQGQALLALGLAERLHGLQQVNLQASEQSTGHDLATLLARREAMLRLVDPHALGDFRWLAFRRGDRGEAASQAASGSKTEPTSRRAAGAWTAESQPAEFQPGKYQSAELELERFELPLFLRQPDK
jgi:SAM-dependent MidA family methyltransferase